MLFYLTTDWFVDLNNLSPTKYPAIYHCIISTPASFTGEALQAYKFFNIIFLLGFISKVKQDMIGRAYSAIFPKTFSEPGQHKNCSIQPFGFA